MDDDDDTRTPSLSPTPSPPPNVTPPEPTLVLPSRHPRRAAAAVATAVGGREEFWSEGATWTLIDAWGGRFLELSRGSLKQKEWQEVADAVNRAAGAGFPKSDAQCKNRIDTLKKKYKVEKTKITSSWPFFRRLDDLLTKPSGNGADADAGQIYLLPHCNRKKRTGKKKSHRQLLQALKPVTPQWPESSDSFPPAKKRRWGKKPVAKAKPVVEEANKGVKQLTTAIVRLGEIYERVERSKLRQTAELEKQRMAFAKELELQRMQFFIKTQLEITQLKRCHGNNNNNDNHSDANNDS